MEPNPYEAPKEPTAKKGSSTGWFVGGGVCIFLALSGLKKMIEHRPWLDHGLPFIAGELFVHIAFIVVGAFCLWRGYRSSR